jgi:hypothetical protein
MSLDTYANLKLELIDWSHRDDLDLKIDTFIDLAESEMFANSVEPLQLRSEETLTAFSTNTSDRFVALPAGFQSMRKVRIQVVNGESVELEYRTPAQLQILSSTGFPLLFTVTDQVEMERVSDQVYSGEFQYYKDFTALSSSNTTNDVLTNHPTIYLFGALWALKTHVNEPQAAIGYYQQFISAIKGANNKSKIGRYGPVPSMRAETSPP